jgi:DNA-binding NarL/FixJ family response regulator
MASTSSAPPTTAIRRSRRAASCAREVLTLDLAMPGLDGIGVLRGLQKTDLPVSVVVVSAFSPAHGVSVRSTRGEDSRRI